MANTWMKLYHETLNDPKMGTMTDHLYRRTIELFLLAGQEDRAGLLPPLTQIAWALRTTVNDATLCLQELAELGIVTKLQDGNYIITNFAKRQDSNLSDAERSQKRREKQKASRDLSDVRHADHVTDDTPNVTQFTCRASRNLSDETTENVTPDKDIDKDIDKDKDKDLINKAAGAAAREKAAHGKYSPDQEEFWQRAFGAEAKRAREFSRESGIVPVGTEFGRWQKDLRNFTEARISIPLMLEAVRKVRKEGKYPIKAPGTVFTVARNLAAGSPRSPAEPADYLEGVTWEGMNDE